MDILHNVASILGVSIRGNRLQSNLEINTCEAEDKNPLQTMTTQSSPFLLFYFLRYHDSPGSSRLYYTSPCHGLNNIPSDDIPHQVKRNSKADWHSNLPKVYVAILDTTKLFKVHSEITRQESQWQKQNRDEGQLLHALVLRSA